MKISRWLVAVIVLMSVSMTASAEYLETKVNFSERLSSSAETLVVLVPADTQELSLSGWSNETAAQINRAMQVREFTGAAKQQLEVIAPMGLSVDRLVLVGVGTPSDLTRIEAEEIGAALANHVNSTKAATVHVDTSLVSDVAENGRISASIAHGVDLRNYRFDRFKSEPEPRPSQSYEWLVVSNSAAEAYYADLQGLANGVFLARELVNLPGSTGYPAAFAEMARAALEPLGIEVTILGPEQVRELGMGSLYGVSQGSQHKAHLLVAHWKGSDDQPIALVGKGNTFDTGGYNLKTSSASILAMTTDKAGAAAVVGTVAALAAERAPINVVAVAPLSHNLISGEAQLPGDVVTAGDGSTIEVANTDAEGRLILADGIWYAREHFNPRVIADIATLTGAKVGALGTEYSAIFSEQEDIIRTLRTAGENTSELVWQLPLGPYRNVTSSRIADRRNTGSPGAQAGALFLQHFAGDTPWVHIDMAGNALIPSASGIHPEGATGYGVRLLTEWVKIYSAE
ncbi:peptidase M17 [Aliidiomarina shirensis]|uniref:Probable cytosol aminopeptidase n=1 Tax=Aliidiomarina shirensis TaxID=1048642 RepID=A0A432WVF9_9GAMM|nr:M17 family peptidase N-terminal domain-containing protein [Aliidiomarina shirensis]RUO37753.1 peptidase M17 [Aliidiomarina shirensis]